jgi:hypothetical protein
MVTASSIAGSRALLASRIILGSLAGEELLLCNWPKGPTHIGEDAHAVHCVFAATYSRPKIWKQMSHHG